MIDNDTFIQQSLISNLFYLRNMRDFALNIKLSFFNNNQDLISTADEFSDRCESFGKIAIDLAEGRIDEVFINKDILFTQYTVRCERLTEKLFNVNVKPELTVTEIERITGYNKKYTDDYINKVLFLDREVLNLVNDFLDFINYILDRIEKNELFSYSYPTFYKYINLETSLFKRDLERLINKTGVDPIYVVEFQYFYSQAIKWQAQLLRGLCDPNNDDIITKTNYYSNEFEKLANKIQKTELSPDNIKNINTESINLLNGFKGLLISAIEQLLDATAYFIVEPVFLDNFLTDINFYIYVLENDNPNSIL